MAVVLRKDALLLVLGWEPSAFGRQMRVEVTVQGSETASETCLSAPFGMFDLRDMIR